ncbi:hypothetical protein [Arthrobacter silvisoli]|uniref:hypothetical protein n=1 Tax=Arthrobacter silvisoli TaxID=2291022 RepID=UPI00109B9054|nr:hypothetical protein [Arthrobacter silvisoli]
MSGEIRFVFPDTCLLMNFAAVDRLDIVKNTLDGRGEWGETVCDEVARWGQDPNFGPLAQVASFMPPAIIPTYDEMLHAQRIRLGFAQPGDGPRKHLGEAETLALIESQFDATRTIVFTEDKPTAVQCTRRGVATAGTRALLEAAAHKGLLTWAEADSVALAIKAAKRPVLGYPPPIRQPIPRLGN